MPEARLNFRCSQDELDWLKHAASLERLSMTEYIKRAVNAQLQKSGVDAVLFKESTDG